MLRRARASVGDRSATLRAAPATLMPRLLNTLEEGLPAVLLGAVPPEGLSTLLALPDA